jgi:hypothetical protein
MGLRSIVVQKVVSDGVPLAMYAIRVNLNSNTTFTVAMWEWATPKEIANALRDLAANIEVQR